MRLDRPAFLNEYKDMKETTYIFNVNGALARDGFRPVRWDKISDAFYSGVPVADTVRWLELRRG